tara:strand:+ start:1148 stop:2449 length:1302 start_codon:yes stop_codon:yes gene_type:complete
MKNKIVDILKINHWLNVRKVTIKYISQRNRSLAKKINSKKNFYLNEKDLNFLSSELLIPYEKIQLEKKISDYIFWNREKINRTKRPINRDGIHFYNYYSLPSPRGFVGPVILDILCPKTKLPKLNNGHMEPAITVNLGKSDIYGRWGKKLNKINFSKIKFNSSKKNEWIVGDTYVEPIYCPHSYARATDYKSKILSYTVKSPAQKLVKNLNKFSEINYKNFIKKFNNLDPRSSILEFYLENRGVNISYISKKIQKKIFSINQIINNKKLLKTVCKILNIDSNLFNKKKYLNEDNIGKTFLSFKKSFKTIRKYKSYLIASMASSERYPDLYGLFLKINNKKNIKDLKDYTSSHYLVTGGKLKFHVANKIINMKDGDALWISPFTIHGFSGQGSLIKISNGESLDSHDLSEILNLYKAKKTLVRSYKDNLSWGYE